MPQSATSGLPRGQSTVIPGNQIFIESDQSPPAGPHKIMTPHVDSPAAPTVIVIKDGDTVRAIEVTCTCGEIIRIECSH